MLGEATGAFYLKQAPCYLIQISHSTAIEGFPLLHVLAYPFTGRLFYNEAAIGGRLDQKTFITAQQLLDDAYRLGAQVLADDFMPNYIVAVWRGGTPVGIAIQEFLDFCGVESDHIAIRTSYYTGINQRAEQVQVHGLHYLSNRLCASDRLLLVDDVFDSGASMQQIVLSLQQECQERFPQYRIATPYYKPENNRTALTPHYYLHQTDQWLVFPHELKGLTAEEISKEKPGIDSVRSLLLSHLKQAH